MAAKPTPLTEAEELQLHQYLHSYDVGDPNVLTAADRAFQSEKGLYRSEYLAQAGFGDGATSDGADGGPRGGPRAIGGGASLFYAASHAEPEEGGWGGVFYWGDGKSSADVIYDTFGRPITNTVDWLLDKAFGYADPMATSQPDPLGVNANEEDEDKAKKLPPVQTKPVAPSGVPPFGPDGPKGPDENGGKSKTEKSYSKTEIVDQNGKPIGEFDRIEGLRFIEEKDATGLSRLNPRTLRPQQTPEQWARDKIYDQTANRLDNIERAAGTRPNPDGLGSPDAPTLDLMKQVRTQEFEIKASTPEVRLAVERQIVRLRLRYPDWDISAKFGD